MENDSGMIGFEAMLASAAVTISMLTDEHPGDVAQLTKMDRLAAISTFAALLTCPELQSNTYRLEALVHIAVAKASGRKYPTADFVRKVFKRFGNGPAGSMEDPAEDLFTSAVHCSDGNFLVFEGPREGNGFYLQRIIDVMDDIPRKGWVSRMRRAVIALLTLSDAVARRAGLMAGVLGRSRPHADLPEVIAKRLNEMRRWMKFDAADLEELGISVDDLSPFLLRPTHENRNDDRLIDSPLERHPLIRFEDVVCFALPISVGHAITRFVIDTMTTSGNLKVFQTGLVVNYWKQLQWTTFANFKVPPPLRPTGENGLWVGSTLREIEAGRYIHLVVLVQPLRTEEDAEEALFADSMELSHAAMQEIQEASRRAHTMPGFREGLSLVVDCTTGQACMFLGEAPPPEWEIEFVPIHDAITMAWMEGFQESHLFRMASAKKAVEAAGIELMNINGLLNLWAWANELKGHLIPHSDLPEAFRSTEGRRTVVVRQNGLLKLRAEVQARSHMIVALTPEGQWTLVRRLAESMFEDDLRAPVYVAEVGLMNGTLATTYISYSCHWWIDLSTASENKNALHEHWRMLCCWLVRTVPILEQEFGEPPASSIRFHVHFETMMDFEASDIQIPTETALRDAFQIKVSQAPSIIKISVGRAFDFALASADNIAEEALVAALVRGYSILAARDLSSSEESAIVARICTSKHARSRHIMLMQGFRDRISLGQWNPVEIDPMDDATARVGIAFRGQANVGGEILGRKECTSFLNNAVKLASDELCVDLRIFNRRHYLEEALRCHEDAVLSREHWRRTAHATIALHGDDAVHSIAERMAHMTAVVVSTRIVIEAAMCECPIEGGFRPGALDLTRAMARAMFAFSIGGWSDAIHWEAIPARVRITPLGDIHVDHTFMEKVYTPFTFGGSTRDLRDAVESYESAYLEREPSVPVEDALDQRFLDAWQAEYGVSLDILSDFIDRLDEIGESQKTMWFERRRSELLALLGECAKGEPQAVAATLDLLTLRTRDQWQQTPSGFRDKDWQPWRFRRRLSLVRRPLIPMDHTEDPQILVAPAIVREALYILLRSAHTGETPDWQVSSSPMRKWLGHTNNVTRTAFNDHIASRLNDLGWMSAADYRVSHLLGTALDHDYGDVDALAWDPESGRVLAIECKHLHFHKTLGEVAEQLNDFRGVTKADGRRDLLKKHLDRIVVLEKHKAAIQKRLKLKAEPLIDAYVVFKHPVPMEFSWPETVPVIRPLLADALGVLRLVTEP